MSRYLVSRSSALISNLNEDIGPLATSCGLATFMREQLGKPIPAPAVLAK